jgi:hypothetical protein
VWNYSTSFWQQTFYSDSPDAAFVVLPVLLPFDPTDPMTSASYWLEYLHRLFAAVVAECFAHYFLHFVGKDLLLA